MDTLEVLENDIESILARYKVPMDDRSLVMERVAGTIGKMAKLSAKLAKSGHDSGQAVAEKVKKASMVSLKKLAGQAKSNVKKAYISGYQMGADGKYPLIHVAVISILVLLVGILIYREIF